MFNFKKNVASQRQTDTLNEDHCLALGEFFNQFGTDLSTGLTSSQVTARRAMDGLNQLTPHKETPLWIQFIQELYRGFGLLLWAAALLCFISWKPLGDPPSVYNLALALVLVFVALFQALFNFFQHRYSSNIIATFQKIIPKKCKVLRDSIWQEVSVPEVCIGDVIEMAAGEQFPADMRILECHQAKLEKSSLTGESKPIALSTTPTDKNMIESKNVGFFGTYLLEGNCTGVVMSIGDHTVMGKIAGLTMKSSQSLTSLQKEINYFVALVALISITTAVVILIAWGAWLKIDYPDYINTPNMIVNVLGVIVAFIPEGLPISVTMTLALVAKRMFKVKLMVKRLGVTETLGSATVIASDKTGTITQNKMSMSQIWIPQDPKNCKPEFEYTNMLTSYPTTSFHEQTLCVLHLSGLCNGAHESKETTGQSSPTNKAPKFIGSSTDVGLIRGAARYFNVEKLRKELPLVAELPFNSRYKCQVTIHQANELGAFMEKTRWDTVLGKPNPGYVKILKGAPEMILKNCSKVILSGTAVDISANSTQMILDAAENLAKKGERVIGFAFELLPQGEKLESGELDEETPHLKNFAFVGLSSLIDPPKDGVMESVDQCHRAGIKVMMVTGDHPTTAVAIAKMVHIVEKEEVTMYDPSMTIEGELRLEVEGAKKEKKPKLEKPRFQEFIRNVKKNFMTTTYSRSKDPIIPKAIAVVGKDINNLDERAWSYILSHQSVVFARTAPEQKLKIVQALQMRGEVVAVTGDGVNDAPALKNADIGVAMGNGSDVSKEASNIIVFDNSFTTIVEGIKEGRLLFDNLQKVTAYLLPAGCFSEIVPVLLNIFLGMPLALSSFQMIIICVGSDIIGTLGLVYETPEPGLMERKPRDPKNDRLINMKVIGYAYLQVGIIQTIIAYFMYFYTFHRYGINPSDIVIAYSGWGSDGYLGLSVDSQNYVLARAQTAYYVALVMTQLWNLQCARTKRQSYFQSKFRKDMILYMIGEAVVVCFVCFVPFMNTYLNTAPAEWYHFVYPLLMGSVLLIVEECRKLYIKKHPNSFLARIAW